MSGTVRFGAFASLVVVLLSACASFSSSDDTSSDAGHEGGATDAAMADEAFAVDAGDAADAADAVGPDAGLTPLVSVPSPGAQYSIEAKEVTVEQFAVFAGHYAFAAGDFARCPGKAAIGPQSGCAARLLDTDPITCVDWCDADLYCKAIGRRLCGAIGGGAVQSEDLNTIPKDEWYRACTGPSLGFAYPYGPNADASICNTQTAGPVAPGSLADCHGSQLELVGIFDMSGNAYEWTNDCDGEAVPQCTVRGGSWRYPDTAATCASGHGYASNDPEVDVGIRCCATP